MQYFIKGLQEYFNFSGRARRKEYWIFILIYFLINVGLGIISTSLAITWLVPLFGLFMLIPSISYATRRLHDTGRSGWWQLIYIIPLVGLIVMIVFLTQDSEKIANAYGESPKYGQI